VQYSTKVFKVGVKILWILVDGEIDRIHYTRAGGITVAASEMVGKLAT
jgi:hypothetical protein